MRTVDLLKRLLLLAFLSGAIVAPMTACETVEEEGEDAWEEVEDAVD